VAEQILAFVAGQLRRLGDPRFEWITLTDIDMSPDLKTAWIYWSAFSNTPQSASSPDGAAVKNQPKGSELDSIGQALTHVGAELKLRYTPNRVFKYDSSSVTGSRIEELLREARRNSEGQEG
jgi:ribosome-binding factor A